MTTAVLTEEQQTIQRTARELVSKELPVSHLRALRDRRDADGFSRAIWKELAELGFVGIAVPEALGGSGLGYAELGLVAEELGRTLAPTPLLSTAVLGASALQLGERPALARDVLPAVCAGDRLLALAVDEHHRHAPDKLAARIEGGHLRADKLMVLDGHIADAFIVAAVDGVYYVPADAPGVEVTRTSLVDSRNAANVRFDVAVTDDQRLGGRDLLERVLDRGRVALAAEMLGGARQAFALTLDYLKTRKQFGVPIGSFQALKHRAAWMFCELELSTSIVAYALRSLDDARLASAAKARVSDTFMLVANEAVQMHGGIGVTDDHDIGLYLKRARVAELTLGDAIFHRDRFARLSGY